MAQSPGLDWRPILAPGGRWSALVVRGSGPTTVAQHCGGGLNVLACPYIEEVHRARDWQIGDSVRLGLLAAREVMRLRMVGVTAICPALQLAVMCEAAHLVPDAPPASDRAGWADWARPFLSVAQQLVVPDVPGWDRCPIILGQVDWALSRNMRVHVYAGGAV